MELKEYQVAALEAFSRWLDALESARRESEKAANVLRGISANVPGDIRNYPKAAWERLAESGRVAESAGEYASRTDDAERPIPHVCFKVPTGGGKTLLAAAALGRIRRQTGLTLWITPTRAIYDQTQAALRNREHPYRQMLERASGGRVKILEKDDLFTRADTANYLCVMLLMHPAANRRKGRDFLRMFRDSGRYPTLFPDSDAALGDGELLERYPDLDRTSDGGPVKHSLYNVFKMLRPVVILDEAHKAYGSKQRKANEEFVRSVNQLNPSLVIELSATPNKGISNLLVDITGVELKQEEMIKLPVQVESLTKNADWKHTLAAAHDKLEDLAAEAQSLEANDGRYIRPIAVVRVERTGKDQRDNSEFVHAEDVRDHLIQNLAVPAKAVAVKSSEVDELQGVDPLSPFCPVRWVITKSALMEGWDCPFAYVLVMLDNTRAQRALTQLVGRVMRQPNAQRTGRETLDQCYVYCRNTDIGEAVRQVKKGLEDEGLTGLGGDVLGESASLTRVTLQRREEFRGKDIFLPMVLHLEGPGWCELDYQRHILPNIEWHEIDAGDLQTGSPEGPKWQSAEVDVGDTLPVYHKEREPYIDKTIRLSWFTRRLADVIPNPWQAARVTQNFLEKWRAEGATDEDIYDRRSHLAYELRNSVAEKVEEQAKRIFHAKLRGGEIRFDLETGQPNFRMKEQYEIPVVANDHSLERRPGESLQLNLFEPILNSQFDSELERNFARYIDSKLEQNFARYIDEQKALRWWHRVAARQRGDYYLRGWKQERIWPDFVAMAGETDGKPHVLVFETKGAHLENSDTAYKRRVLDTLENAFNCGTMTIREGPARGTFRIVIGDSDKKTFPEAFNNLDASYTA